MNELCEKIFGILKTELSEISARSMVDHFTRKIGKDPTNLAIADLPAFSMAILESIYLFSDAAKAQRISQGMKSLIT
ncbi:MAG TPA: hypothetical protein VFG95_01640 [Nitrospiria bacterium]|nr:hypothetical protein [Nitrospiria bacterium]